jgi:hypothetical protein
MLAGLLVHMGRTKNTEPVDLGGQGDGARHTRSGSFGFDDDILDRLIQQTMVE